MSSKGWGLSSADVGIFTNLQTARGLNPIYAIGIE
jgi:hypothetical protein